MREAGKWSQPHSLLYRSLSKAKVGQNWEFSSYTQSHVNAWIGAFFFLSFFFFFFTANVIGELFLSFILHQNSKGLSLCTISLSFVPSISQAFAHTILQNLLLSRHKWLPNIHTSGCLLSVLNFFDPKPVDDISPFFFVHFFHWLPEHNSFLKLINFNWRLITIRYCAVFCVHGHESAAGAHVSPRHHRCSHVPRHHRCSRVPPPSQVLTCPPAITGAHVSPAITGAHVSPRHHKPPSQIPPHPIPPDCPSALFHASNLDWSSISHFLIYMFQCYSLKASHPHLLPQSPKLCSLYLCLFCCLTYNHHYHLSKFHIYALIYCIGVFLSDLLHAV